jgi:hypothetical protein
MQVSVVNRIKDIKGIVGRMGNVEPAKSALHRGMIESASPSVFGKFDMSQ